MNQAQLLSAPLRERRSATWRFGAKDTVIWREEADRPIFSFVTGELE